MRKFLLTLTAAALGLTALGCGSAGDDKPTAATPAPIPGVVPDAPPALVEPPAYVVPPVVTPMNLPPIDTAPPPIIPVSLDTPVLPTPPAVELPTIPLPPLPMMK